MTAGSVSAPLIIPIMHLHTSRAKNHIDTSTPVSIHSDTPGVQIFYTLDSSKPSVIQRSSSANSSRRYREPVLLPAGRVSVRAVAVSSDGRESSTVTKVFSVELVEVKNMEENLLQQRVSEGSSRSTESSLKPPEPRIMGNAFPPSAPLFLNSRLAPPTSSILIGRLKDSRSARSEVVPEQLSSTDASRICRRTDFLRCASCLSFCPSDPLARFCPCCGAALPVIPGQRAPPAEGGQTVCCVFCNSLVPVNTHTCLICENSISPQLRPQAGRALQDPVVCVCCGSGNPAHISSCLTCESRLQPVVCVENSAPSGPSPDSRKLTCSRCERVNNSDARYCDWCGTKACRAASVLICWRCGASGQPGAAHCAACGVCLEAPPTSCDITTNIRGTVSKQTTPSSSHTHRQKQATPTADQGTQTVGLYYPAATELQRMEQQRALKEGGARERRPPLTAISPGRGFWRKQLDHVCAHLRSYAQNNAAFRALLGEPRLGRVTCAVIQEDPQVVSLTINFLSAARQSDKQVELAGDLADQPGATETLSSFTERSADSCHRGSERPAGAMKVSKQSVTPKPPVKDMQLLKELGPGPGRGQISVIEKLLDQGADPSCCNSDGRPALTLAVMNGHHDVLPVLVQRGAHLETPSGPMKNTALHEAATRGSEGLHSLKLLLSWKASVSRRNAGGLTAFDLAVNSGCEDAVHLLAAQSGLDLLGTLGTLGTPKLV